MVDSHFRKDSLGITSVEKTSALRLYQILAVLECQKRELHTLVQRVTPAPAV